ncbi:hypothetical protein CSUI_008063, partial [Cystoisospora suis]
MKSSRSEKSSTRHRGNKSKDTLFRSSPSKSRELFSPCGSQQISRGTDSPLSARLHPLSDTSSCHAPDRDRENGEDERDTYQRKSLDRVETDSLFEGVSGKPAGTPHKSGVCTAD